MLLDHMDQMLIVKRVILQELWHSKMYLPFNSRFFYTISLLEKVFLGPTHHPRLQLHGLSTT